MGRISDRLDSGLYQALCDLGALDFGIVRAAICTSLSIINCSKVIDPRSFHTTDHETDQPRIGIEHSLDYKSRFSKFV